MSWPPWGRSWTPSPSPTSWRAGCAAVTAAPSCPAPWPRPTPPGWTAPRVVALGFQLNQGQFIGPIDFFDDVAFDRARQQANEIADMLHRHGPFEPHRLPLEEMEYTTMPQIMGRLADRLTAV